MPTIIRTMLVEDNRDYRSVIEHALEVEPDIELVSQFSTPEIALRSLEDHKTRTLSPNCYHFYFHKFLALCHQWIIE